MWPNGKRTGALGLLTSLVSNHRRSFYASPKHVIGIADPDPHPDEDAIITRWLKPRSKASVAHLSGAMARLGVKRAPSEPYWSLDAAVASVILLPVEQRLPQWTDGVVYAREYTDPDRKLLRKVSLSPILLFSINWATSGPGFDWPEAYCLTLLPTHGCYVVTGSADSPECYGDRDFALGSVPPGADVTAAACAVISKDWRRRRRIASQPPWEDFLEAGTVSTVAAVAMRAEVWRNFQEDI